MVRLSDLPEDEAAHLAARAQAMPAVEPSGWVDPPPVADATVAIISTAGMHRRCDPPFSFGAVDYRIIPGDVAFGDLVSTHVSVNFDRSALQEDPNIAFPIDRLREMAADGEIGGVGRWHYSFMGAMGDPRRFEETGTEVGRLLAADGVDVALLVPI
jgi:D-proline reductase (dithiol) PrdB